MILHLGNEVFVSHKDVVMILDYREASSNRDTGLFLRSCGTKYVSRADAPASVVLVEEDGGYTVYVSPISADTLAKRSSFPLGG